MRGIKMKYIELTQGKVAIVDDADYEELNKHKWSAFKNGRSYYPRRHPEGTCRGTKKIFMHNVLLKPRPGFFCDHKNRNGLDNRRENLRECTRAENNRNVGITTSNNSGYKGVGRHKGTGKYRSRIHYFGEEIHLGLFDCAEDAAIVYDKKAIELFGEFAWLNFPIGNTTDNPELLERIEQ